MSMYSGIGSFAKRFQTGGDVQMDGGGGTPGGSGVPPVGTSGGAGGAGAPMSFEQFLAAYRGGDAGGLIGGLTADVAYQNYLQAFNVSGGNVNVTNGNINVRAKSMPSYMSLTENNQVLIPVGTTNRQFIEAMNLLGLLPDDDYRWLLEYFTGENGEGTWLAANYNQPDTNIDRDNFFGGNDLNAENTSIMNRLFDAFDAGSQAGGFTASQGFLNEYSTPTLPGQYYDSGASPRPVFIGQPPTGGTAEQPYYSLSDVLVTSSEQPNLYDRFNPYPEGGFPTVDPYSTPVDLAYGYKPPEVDPVTGTTVGTDLVFETESATPVDQVVADPDVYTGGQGTGGTGITVNEDVVEDIILGESSSPEERLLTQFNGDQNALLKAHANTAFMLRSLAEGDTRFQDWYERRWLTGKSPFSGDAGIYTLTSDDPNTRANEAATGTQSFGEMSFIEKLAHSISRGTNFQNTSGATAEDIAAAQALIASDPYQFTTFDSPGGAVTPVTTDTGARPAGTTETTETTTTSEAAQSAPSALTGYQNISAFRGQDPYLFGKRGLVSGLNALAGSRQDLTAEEFASLLSGQQGRYGEGSTLAYDPRFGIYSTISDAELQGLREQQSVPSYIDPRLMTDVERVRSNLTGGGTYTRSVTDEAGNVYKIGGNRQTVRIGDKQYFVNEDGSVTSYGVEDINYTRSPRFNGQGKTETGFAEGGIVDVYSGDMANMRTTGEGIESFLNPERSKATLRRNLAKLAPRPTAPVMQQGIMPMAR